MGREGGLEIPLIGVSTRHRSRSARNQPRRTNRFVKIVAFAEDAAIVL